MQVGWSFPHADDAFRRMLEPALVERIEVDSSAHVERRLLAPLACFRVDESYSSLQIEREINGNIATASDAVGRGCVHLN